jgi:hypothetical protein
MKPTQKATRPYYFGTDYREDGPASGAREWVAATKWPVLQC